MDADFIQLRGRRLFLAGSLVPAAARTATLLFPPFGDEMNKCRHLCARLRQQLCAVGVNYLQLDPIGTGDSEGLLAEADATEWRDQFLGLAQELHGRGFRSLQFHAIRFGALQMLDLVLSCELPLPLDRVLLWQPQLDAEAFLRQLFRTKLAEQMALGTNTTQALLEETVAREGVLEIGGYPLTPAFLASVRGLQGCAALPLPAPCEDRPGLLWLELSRQPQPGAGARAQIQALAARFDVHARTVAGEPYWSANELAPHSALLAASIDFLRPDQPLPQEAKGAL